MAQANQSKIDGKWFREENLFWEGYSQSHQIEEILYNDKSKYQDVLVFKSKYFGNILVLDGIIQCSERDEFTYQEMMAHIPMNLHKNPEKVLVIGGGDGGVVREVLKYDCVKEVILCEIDEVVIEVSKKFLPSMANSLSDPRVTVLVRDGIEFIRNHHDEFDVIITDSTDPDSDTAASGLFEKNYYQQLKDALKDDGIACCQAETFFIDLESMTSIVEQCKQAFPNVGYATGSVPSYISGAQGYLVATSNKDLDLSKPVRTLTDADIDRMHLKYYNSAVHTAAFVLPNYIRTCLKDII